MKNIVLSTLLSGALALMLPLTATAIDFSGDVRIGQFNKVDGAASTRLRLRAALKYQMQDNIAIEGRFAGRFSTASGEAREFRLYGSIPSGKDGLALGQSTLDKLFISIKSDSGSVTRIGRMQTNFELQGVAKKSLDRNDSPNTDISWTDGFYYKRKSDSGWTTHFIAQYNPAGGATNVRRDPLDFGDDNSRLTYFLAFEKKDKKAHVVQKGIDITFMPNSLCVDGTTTCANIGSYYAVVGRWAAQWPMGNNGMKFLLGTEAGYAPNTQDRTTGSADGLAYQVTFNFVDFVPHHSFGLVVGRAGDGWLISPDFSSNNNLIEGRYKWVLNKKQKIEARYRSRSVIFGAPSTSDDYYVRYTVKF